MSAKHDSGHHIVFIVDFVSVAFLSCGTFCHVSQASQVVAHDKMNLIQFSRDVLVKKMAVQTSLFINLLLETISSLKMFWKNVVIDSVTICIHSLLRPLIIVGQLNCILEL